MALSYHILSYGIATETQIPRHDLITRNTKGDHQVHPGTTHFSVAIFPTHFSFAAEYKTEWLPRKSPFTLRHLKSRLEPRRNWALSVLPADSRSERLFSRAELIGKEIVSMLIGRCDTGGKPGGEQQEIPIRTQLWCSPAMLLADPLYDFLKERGIK